MPVDNLLAKTAQVPAITPQPRHINAPRAGIRAIGAKGLIKIKTSQVLNTFGIHATNGTEARVNP